MLLRTFTSRFYRITGKADQELGAAKKFLEMEKIERINFLRELLDDEESGRANANKFLNELEVFLHNNGIQKSDLYEQIFSARDYLRQPGSSAKNLLESVALML